MVLSKNIRNKFKRPKYERLNEKCAEKEKLQNIDIEDMDRKITNRKERVLFNRMHKI